MEAAMALGAQAVVTELLARADIQVDGPRPWDLWVGDPRLYARVLADGTLGFGEAYMDGWWDCGAIDELCCRAIRARLDEIPPRRWRHACVALAAKFLNLQTRRRARRVGEVHYDLGNDFFAAMLGPEMQYSCGYFRDTDNLAEAQHLKMDLICRKLGLQPGMTLLDIGCGWGGLARHAAARHGCRVTGITISREQQAFATEATRGLPVEIRLQDYRDVTGPFDRVVSVGMMEHVGHLNHRRFMACAARCLRDDGLFLCHTIGGTMSRQHTDPWVARYIFPNSLVPSPAQVMRAAEGLFVLEDLHSFGPCYDRTLLAWERNFRGSWDRFRGRYGDRFERMWRFYLLSCAGSFRARHLDVFQFLFSRHGLPGGCTPVR